MLALSNRRAPYTHISLCHHKAHPEPPSEQQESQSANLGHHQQSPPSSVMPFCPCLKVILFTWQITPLSSFLWILLVNKNTTLFLPIQYFLFIRHCACKLGYAAYTGERQAPSRQVLSPIWFSHAAHVSRTGLHWEGVHVSYLMSFIKIFWEQRLFRDTYSFV